MEKQDSRNDKPNMDIYLTRNEGIGWFQLSQATTRVWVKGFAFRDNTLLQADDLARLLIVPDNSQDRPRVTEYLKYILKELNGQFAAVVKYDGWSLVAVDRMRSIPLFYGEIHGELFLSDDPACVLGRAAREPMDDLACAEFLLASYVTGPDTLYASVKQVQAGEMLVVENGCSGEAITAHRYYRFLRRSYLPLNEEEFLHHLDVALEGAIRRLIVSANGRPLVVPLSGGFDSRIIVLLLKRLGYDDIITFSYGIPGNRESEISREVAERLRLRWLFIPYSQSRWYHWFHSSEREAYYDYAAGLSSLPHLQDWPAVKVLREDKMVPEDSVFVPGHTGDFIGGKHVPQWLYRRGNGAVDTAIPAILCKHFWLNDIRVLDGKVRTELERKIKTILRETPSEAPDRAINAYESWEWQERQAKFIVNSCRAYEFWGYEWRIPLWDWEVMTFWEHVPIVHRIGKRLYNKYVNQQSASLGLSNANPRSPFRRLKNKALARLNRIEYYQRAMQTVRPSRRKRIYDSHFLGWYGIMPERVFQKFHHGRQHLYSYLVEEYLGRIRF